VETSLHSGSNRPRGQLPTSPPAEAVIPRRSPLGPTPGESIASHYRWCIGCGTDHPSGLHIRITAGAGVNVLGIFTVSEHHQGAPGLAHGGLLTTALDEILGSLNWLLAGPAVTGRLEVDFRRPVPVGTELYVEAEVVGVLGRKVFTKAVGRMGGLDGPVAVSAAALFIQVPLEHFVEHGTGSLVQRAVEDRASGGPAWRTVAEQPPVEVNP